MNEKTKITRTIEISRAENNDGKKIISGYASVFDTETLIGDEEWGFKEKIIKGAFNDSIINNPVLALYNHDFNNVLARKGQNLKLWEDEKGLGFEIILPNTAQANDLYTLVKENIVNQCSFAGYIEEQVWEEKKGGLDLRTIKKINLIEITITPIPAYQDTIAMARKKEFENNTNNTKSEELMKIALEAIKKI